MAWKQSRTTRRLLAQGEINDGRHCRICGRGIPRRSALRVCNQPRCQAKYSDKYDVGD